MREESQLEDMRSAIRGDFERLAERRGEQELMRVSDEEQEEPALSDTADDPVSDTVSSVRLVEEARPSWLARLVGR